MALNCKGKNKAGGACGMRPPKDKDYCIRHQGQAGETTTTTQSSGATEQKKGTTVAGELSALAAAGIGVGVGLLGLCVWLVWRPKKPAAAAKPQRQLRVA
jgi:hypothetical protein